MSPRGSSAPWRRAAAAAAAACLAVACSASSGAPAERRAPSPTSAASISPSPPGGPAPAAAPLSASPATQGVRYRFDPTTFDCGAFRPPSGRYDMSWQVSAPRPYTWSYQDGPATVGLRAKFGVDAPLDVRLLIRAPDGETVSRLRTVVQDDWQYVKISDGDVRGRPWGTYTVVWQSATSPPVDLACDGFNATTGPAVADESDASGYGPPNGSCARLTDELRLRIGTRPAGGVSSLELAAGYVLPGRNGTVAGGFLHGDGPGGPFDGRFGTWYITLDGAIHAYTDAAPTLTAWPRMGTGAATALSRKVRGCADANAG